MTTETEPAYPRPGEILDDKYEIQDLLGVGAMGAVVRAQHTLRKAPVALKFVSPEIVGKRGVVDRFLNEAVAASKIDSEHVVKVFDVSRLPNGAPYMVMEFLEGEDLSQLLRRHQLGLDEVPRAIHMALQILRGLQVAHEARIVHRDMKPANCFVTGKDGDPDFIKIVDFGISKLREEGGLELTQAGSALGTPLYMSPEQARNPKDVDARSDLYAVAAILYELLAGRPPFVPTSGTISELFVMLGTEEPPSLEEVRDDLPPGLWSVIAKGLEKKTDNRYQTAAAMAEALAPFSDERSDYIVAKMLRSTAVGITRRSSLRPPPAADDRAGSGTMLMGDGARPVSQAIVIEPTVASGPATAAQAETAQGAVADARTVAEAPKSTPLVWAVAIVAVAATAVAAWALGQATAGSTLAPQAATPTSEAVPSVTAMVPVIEPPTATPPTATASEPDPEPQTPPEPPPHVRPLVPPVAPPPIVPKLKELTPDR